MEPLTHKQAWLLCVLAPDPEEDAPTLSTYEISDALWFLDEDINACEGVGIGFYYDRTNVFAAMQRLERRGLVEKLPAVGKRRPRALPHFWEDGEPRAGMAGLRPRCVWRITAGGLGAFRAHEAALAAFRD